MSAAEVREAILSIAEEVFEADPEELHSEAHLEADLGATSVVLMDFLVALERRFDVAFHHEELKDVHTIGAVTTLVEARLGLKPAADPKGEEAGGEEAPRR